MTLEEKVTVLEILQMIDKRLSGIEDALGTMKALPERTKAVENKIDELERRVSLLENRQ